MSNKRLFGGTRLGDIANSARERGGDTPAPERLGPQAVLPTAELALHGRTSPGLTRETVLRAITINAAYELHEDDVTGSLEVGKFADLIVLDRNPLTIAAEDIAKVVVLETVVGGKTVYTASQP